MDFNQYADDYSDHVREAIAFAGQDHAAFLDAKIEPLRAMLSGHFGPDARPRVLDLGCGVGSVADRLQADPLQLTGVDVALGALTRARQAPRACPVVAFDGSRLPFGDGQFDAVMTICVVHHVPVSAWHGFFREMVRVVRPGGLAIVFEHNPLNPLTRYVVSRCEFDRDAVLLSAGRTRRHLEAAGLRPHATGYVLFTPWRGGFWRFVDRKLSALPLGAQYFVAGEKGE